MERLDITTKLIENFDAKYSRNGRNDTGIELLNKRASSEQVEYFVSWTGRPKNEDSWVKDSTISQRLTQEFKRASSLNIEHELM